MRSELLLSLFTFFVGHFVGAFGEVLGTSECFNGIQYSVVRTLTSVNFFGASGSACSAESELENNDPASKIAQTNLGNESTFNFMKSFLLDAQQEELTLEAWIGVQREGSRGLFSSVNGNVLSIGFGSIFGEDPWIRAPQGNQSCVTFSLIFEEGESEIEEFGWEGKTCSGQSEFVTKNVICESQCIVQSEPPSSEDENDQDDSQESVTNGLQTISYLLFGMGGLLICCEVVLIFYFRMHQNEHSKLKQKLKDLNKKIEELET